MKFPEDKQQRIKVIAAIVLGTTLVVLGIVQGIIFPVLNSKKEKLDRLAQCDEGLRVARKEIGHAKALYQRGKESIATVKDLSDKYILQPVLGNYLLSATEIIEKAADQLGLQDVAVREAGISEIPPPRDKKTTAFFKAYTARVNLVCGFAELVRLLKTIEKGNPYLCLSALSIQVQPSDPERQTVSFDLQWPIWVDPETPSLLAVQASDQSTPEWMRQ